jgi:surface antigen
MRHLSLASIAITAMVVGKAVAATCYLPAEIEADQAIKLRAELKVVGELCKDPSFAVFSGRNQATLAAYEQIIAEHLVRSNAGSDLGAYVRSLEKEAMEHAAASPSFCADSFDTVALVGEMRPSDLHAYAIAKAETARKDYAVCAAPVPREAAPSSKPPIVSAGAATDLPSTAPAPASSPAAAPLAAAPRAATVSPPAAMAAPPAVPALPPAPTASPRPAAPASSSSLASPASTSPAVAEEDVRPALGDASLARMLSRADRRRLIDTTQQALETALPGQVLSWHDQWRSSGGTVVAARAFQNADNQWCRRYDQSILVSGEIRRASGIACRRQGGIWENTP